MVELAAFTFRAIARNTPATCGTRSVDVSASTSTWAASSTAPGWVVVAAATFSPPAPRWRALDPSSFTRVVLPSASTSRPSPILTRPAMVELAAFTFRAIARNTPATCGTRSVDVSASTSTWAASSTAPGWVVVAAATFSPPAPRWSVDPSSFTRTLPPESSRPSPAAVVRVPFFTHLVPW